MACDILGAAATGHDAQSKLETLKRLKYHMKEIQKQCTLLEKELAVQNLSVGNIRAMPPEILAIILGFYVKERSRSIRRLMLVCRQWHDLAIHNPQLWTSIRIDAYSYQGDHQHGAKRLRPFIQACVQRSGAALLHIDLDFGCLCPWDDYVETELIAALSNLFPASDMIQHWVTDADWSWCMEDGDGDPPGHHNHMLELLHDLGPKDRWGSLKLVNSEYYELAGEIWTLLAGDTPNLKSLSVNEHPDDELEGLEILFSDLSSLEILKVPDIATLQILDPPSSLKHLEVGTCLDQYSVEVLNGLTGLHTLKILSSYSHAIPLGLPITLNLSNLRSLHLVKSPTRSSRIKYNLPALQELFLMNQDKEFSDHPLAAQPLHVQWTLLRFWESDVSSVVEKILTQYSTAQCMTTTTNAKSAVLEVVTQFKRTGKISAKLETLVFETYSGVIDEIIRVVDI